MHIQIATIQHREAVHDVYLSAFPKSERDRIAKLAIELLAENTTPQTISLVAEMDDAIVGHTAFSPITLEHDEHFQAYILAPLGVKADYQKRRIGTKLIEYGLQQLSAISTQVVFVYGDPNYYGQFGFSAETSQPYIAPYKLQYPFGWQAIVLNQTDIEKTPAPIRCVEPLCDPTLW